MILNVESYSADSYKWQYVTNVDLVDTLKYCIDKIKKQEAEIAKLTPPKPLFAVGQVVIYKNSGMPVIIVARFLAHDGYSYKIHGSNMDYKEQSFRGLTPEEAGV